jgi:hypothetical protein
MPFARHDQAGVVAEAFSPARLSLALLASPRVRGVRVCILLAAACILGTYDLALTLLFSTTVGMVEMNPLARAIMRVYDSPWMLSAWKVLTMGLSAWIIYRVRHRRIGEAAAWIAFLVLVVLSLHWARFVAGAAEFASEYHTLQAADEHRYVVMGAE